ncbi:metal-dependent transcriptional regulator [Vaginisenegalia massiliensis]|uniref:metal-dependent transcriptional regulator n=1 Tax=Vaginisenegalia massiliensis TaxID=2058294 RepID=UPI000F534660|nr:metal-dependent transcriptional regulator [Vaginisenegalia massiliensis]
MSQSREDYVKFIYETGLEETVANKVIANGLKVAPPSVSEMLSKLALEQLVEYKPYHGAKLTDKGLIMAKDLLRRHEIWEYFLEKKLGYQADQVHELAEVLEHSTPSELADRIATYIEYPG